MRPGSRSEGFGMISDDEYLERIVAGIHAATSTGADVTWNEKINGRQFDVVVRFQLGTLSYLVLVEVKNRTRKASASDMEAFALKARDQNASKSVFVTVAGFQSGAIDVAKRHGLDLFTITFDHDKPNLPEDASWILLKKRSESALPELIIGEPTPVNQIEDITLVYEDGTLASLPNEPSQMNYYAQRTRLSDGRSLNEILEAAGIPDLVLDESYSDELLITPPTHVQPPDGFFFSAGAITSIRFTV
jgi:hypothetical protein